MRVGPPATGHATETWDPRVDPAIAVRYAFPGPPTRTGVQPGPPVPSQPLVGGEERGRVVFLNANLDRVTELVARQYRAWDPEA